MKPARIAAAALILGGAAAVPPPVPDAAAVRDFLGALRPALAAQCVRPFEDADRTSWSYLPGRRVGISIAQMNDAERRAAHAMLRAALSARGYEKTRGVLTLEGILREIEVFGSLRRDPDLYYLTIFGAPSDSAPWGWRFEGHHVSLNFSSATGKLVAATPAFFGAHPARVEKGPTAGLRVLGAEEDLARSLLASLDARQRRSAVISSTAPSDIIFRPGRQSVPAPEGLSGGEMTAGQKATLQRLLDEYLGNMREDVARAQRERIEKAGTDAIRFAWAGSDRPGQAHYSRLQGPTFLVEYDNTQDGANHVHSVFRDLQNDFGGDLLRRHYAESGHHQSHPLLARGERAGRAPVERWSVR